MLFLQWVAKLLVARDVVKFWCAAPLGATSGEVAPALGDLAAGLDAQLKL